MAASLLCQGYFCPYDSCCTQILLITKAPLTPAQVLVAAALSTAGTPAAAVQYVAVHGTGTPLGDPIEVGALGAALGAGRSGASQLLLGSSKVFRHLKAQRIPVPAEHSTNLADALLHSDYPWVFATSLTWGDVDV